MTHWLPAWPSGTGKECGGRRPGSTRHGCPRKEGWARCQPHPPGEPGSREHRWELGPGGERSPVGSRSGCFCVLFTSALVPRPTPRPPHHVVRQRWTLPDRQAGRQTGRVTCVPGSLWLPLHIDFQPHVCPSGLQDPRTFTLLGGDRGEATVSKEWTEKTAPGEVLLRHPGKEPGCWAGKHSSPQAAAATGQG